MPPIRRGAASRMVRSRGHGPAGPPPGFAPSAPSPHSPIGTCRSWNPAVTGRSVRFTALAAPQSDGLFVSRLYDHRADPRSSRRAHRALSRLLSSAAARWTRASAPLPRHRLRIVGRLSTADLLPRRCRSSSYAGNHAQWLAHGLQKFVEQPDCSDCPDPLGAPAPATAILRIDLRPV